MQSVILVILFIALTAGSYLAYPSLGIKVAKVETPKGPKGSIAQVNVPEPEIEIGEPETPENPDKPDKPDEPEKPDMPVAIIPKEPKPPAPVLPTEPTKPEVPGPDADGFVPPTFPPIQKFVGNWDKIPSTVFPRDIKLLVSVECKSDFGGSTLKPGSSAVALSEENGVLVVAPSLAVPVKGQVNIDDTNLKEVLTGIYDNWKARQIATAKATYLYAQGASARKELAGRFSDTQKSVVAGDRPVQNPDGTVPVCIDSINAGKVADIRLRSISKWGPLEFEEIDGTKYWTVTVDYKSKTLFGEIDTQAQALILNNEVQKWIYTGSGEIVP